MTACNVCHDQWSGDKAGHCPKCHLTFSTDANYDRHLLIERGPGVYRVAGHVHPSTVVDKHGHRLLFPRQKANGTTVWTGPPREADINNHGYRP